MEIPCVVSFFHGNSLIPVKALLQDPQIFPNAGRKLKKNKKDATLEAANNILVPILFLSKELRPASNFQDSQKEK